MDARGAGLRFLLGSVAIALGAWLLYVRPGVSVDGDGDADPRRASSLADAPSDPVPAPAPTSAPSSADPAPPFRGRLIDAATDEPIGALRVVAGQAEATSSADGRFVASVALAPEVLEVLVFDDVHGTRVAAIARGGLRSTPDGFLLPISIGPTFALDIDRVDPDELDGWRARLIEIHADGSETSGAFLALHVGGAGDAPFLRYDQPWSPRGDGSWFRVEVKDVRGTRAGSSERLGSARGIFPGRVFVRLDRELARLTGRVIDPFGMPVPGATVTAVSPLAPGPTGAWPSAVTDETGAFLFSELAPDLYDVLVRSRHGERTARRRLQLPPGEIALDDLVLEAAGESFDVHGRLEARSGDLRGDFLLRLRPLDGSASILARRSAPEFALEGLPVGEYELSVLDPEGFAWTPAAHPIGNPWEELSFVREDDTPLVALALETREARTAEPIDEFQVLLQVGAVWATKPVRALRGESFASLPRGTPFRFAAWAEGHRPAYGGDEDFSAGGDLRTAEIELERGFGARFQMKDLGPGFDREDPQGSLAVLERPGVAAVEVWADGRLAAVSDEQGIALLELALEPDSIVCAAPGWRLAGSDGLRGGRLAADARDVVVWFVRE